MTRNNADLGLIDVGFKPDLMFFHKHIYIHGQVGLAAFAVVVNFHTGWKAIYIFGDHQQLKLAGKVSEFGQNAKLSILGLVESKGFKIIRFKVQYRMAPSIMKWPNEYFYNGEIRIHESLEVDNEVRDAGRKISQEFYGIKGPDDRGSEYWHINVGEGISQAKINNTTLVNWANSSAIVGLVEHFFTAEVAPEDIAILTYYLGQKNLHVTRLRKAKNDSGREWEVDKIEVSTIDAFQGKEARVCILDLVAAPMESKVIRQDNEEEDDDDDVSVVVSQMSALALTAKVKSNVAQSAISQMVKDAKDRGLVYNDVTTLDDSPAWLAKRQAWSAQERAQYRAMREMQRTTYLSHSLRIERQAEILPEGTEEIPVYNTRFGRTRRPIEAQAVAEPDAPARTRQEILNDPTAVFQFAKPPQREAKNDRKAKRAEAAERKKAEAAKELTPKGQPGAFDCGADGSRWGGGLRRKEPMIGDGQTVQGTAVETQMR